MIESKVKATKLINEISNAEKLMNKLCSKKEIKNINKIIILMKNEIKNSNNKEKLIN